MTKKADVMDKETVSRRSNKLQLRREAVANLTVRTTLKAGGVQPLPSDSSTYYCCCGPNSGHRRM